MMICTVSESWKQDGNGEVCVTACTSDDWMQALLRGSTVVFNGREYLIGSATPVIQFSLIPKTGSPGGEEP